MAELGTSELDRSPVLKEQFSFLTDSMPRRAKGIAAPLSQPSAWVDESLVKSEFLKEGNGHFAYDCSAFSGWLAARLRVMPMILLLFEM
ncbi:MAG: hypothetical protein DLM69_00155 [Candidatus Chloroheliales bacterium]|nr:MAG: hypothetical protein DLM69_00155 [Chloroflexota bacterium]